MRFIFLLAWFVFTSQAWANSERPNVLLVVADDLGYTDLGSFGGEISTPNLDAVALSGMRLSNFYTAPTCSPTRAMLMTGADNHLVGLGSMAEALRPNQRGEIGYEGYLNHRAAVMPQVFADAGYRTMMTGKWHLGLDEEHSPSARGFQQTFALLQGGAGHFSALSVDGQPVTYRKNGEIVELPENFYSSEFYTNQLIEFIDSGRESEKPFFAYLAYTAPHWPLQAPDESVSRYKGVYRNGYDDLHEKRIASAKKLGVISEVSAPVPRIPGQPSWSELSNDDKKVAEREMEIYAAMVDDMDRHFGRLLDYLKSTGQYDNTIIFFLSDNGAEGSTPNDLFRRFVKHINACCDNSYENLGKPNSFVFYGPNWARAAMGGARDFKGSVTEGGIKSAAFVKFSELNNPGSVSNRFSTVKDVMPTLLQLTGISVPSGFEVPVEGRSIFGSQTAESEMGWEFMGARSYRKGDWKVVSIPTSQKGDDEFHLYDLVNDPGEQIDVKEQNPEKFAELVDLWKNYEREKRIVYPKFK